MGKARCASCEETFAALRERIRRDPLPRWTLALSLLGTIGLFIGAIALTMVLKLSELWLGPLAVMASALPLWVALGRRGLLRLRFQRERPGRVRLHAPMPPIDPPRPRDPLAGWALGFSLVFIMPGMPLLGTALGGLALILQWRRRTTTGRRLAIAAIACGLLIGAAQCYLLFFYDPGPLRGSVTPSVDGKSYLVIDAAGGCGPIKVDGKPWKRGAMQVIRPGDHEISDCGSSLGIQIPPRVVFKFNDYWGP